MARQEHPREDLLRDARNLTPRIQLKLSDSQETEPIFLGFRGDALSVYFGEDPVYHFNPAGELRRAYVDGQLLKAGGGVLTAMVRVRTAESTTLAARDLPPARRDKLIAGASARLERLSESLARGEYEVQGQVPAHSDVLDRVASWLASHGDLVVADSPMVTAGGR